MCRREKKNKLHEINIIKHKVAGQTPAKVHLNLINIKKKSAPPRTLPLDVVGLALALAVDAAVVGEVDKDRSRASPPERRLVRCQGSLLRRLLGGGIAASRARSSSSSSSRSASASRWSMAL